MYGGCMRFVSSGFEKEEKIKNKNNGFLQVAVIFVQLYYNCSEFAKFLGGASERFKKYFIEGA